MLEIWKNAKYKKFIRRESIKRVVKIAIVAPPWYGIPPERYGGIETVLGLLVDGLIERNYEVDLFTVGSAKTKARIFSVFDNEMREYLDSPSSTLLNIALTHSRILL